MNFVDILSVIITAACAIACAFMFYFRVRGNVFGAVSELVAIAEATGMAGPEKMAQVVESLSKMVPKALRWFLTDERLEKIAQWIFDWMRKYADEYRKKIESLPAGEDVPEETTKEISTAAAAELIAELFGLTADALKEAAVGYGVDVDGLKTKRDFIEAIVSAILNKA